MSTALVLILSHASANAIPIVYTDQTTFETAASSAGIVLGLEDFDAFVSSDDLLTNPVSMNGVTVSGSGNDTQLRDSFVQTSGKAPMIRSSTDGGDSITFEFSSGINAIGFDIFDLGTTPVSTTLTLTASGGAQILFEDVSNLAGSPIHFGGVIDTMSSFVSATLAASASGDFVEFDNMRTGALADAKVPSPGTIVLLAIGLTCLLFGVDRNARYMRR